MADFTSLRQGYTHAAAERLPMPPTGSLDEAQRLAAQALSDGPRKGVYGPFLPLLRSPELLDRVANLGEHLRFHCALDARVREFVICVVARHVSNQFEWVMHAPLAVKAGVSPEAIEALRLALAAYPDARAEPCDGGLLLKPSRSAIPSSTVFSSPKKPAADGAA